MARAKRTGRKMVKGKRTGRKKKKPDMTDFDNQGVELEQFQTSYPDDRSNVLVDRDIQVNDADDSRYNYTIRDWIIIAFIYCCVVAMMFLIVALCLGRF